MDPLFTLSLGCNIDGGLVCLGKFDGERHALAVATCGNRVLIFPTSGGSGEDGNISEPQFLNINRQVSALACGQLDASNPTRDILLVGSPSSLLAYDVFDNADRFYVDVPEGVRCITAGRLAGKEPRNGDMLALVGGNCSLQGFDVNGTERFWTVIGGNALALVFCDSDRDGQEELLVGSDDFEVRAFVSEESSMEVTETESVTRLCRMGLSPSRWAYGLSNGTVGVYDGGTRVWRVKAKHQVLCMTCFDLDGDGEAELITGWSNGLLEARRDVDGLVVFREMLSSPVVALLTGDCRGTGKEELVVCTSDGEVRGYAALAPGQSLFGGGTASGGIGARGQGFFSDDRGDKGLLNATDSPMFGKDGDDGDDHELALPLKSRNSMSDEHAGRRLKEDALEPRQGELAELQAELTHKMMELRSLELALGAVTKPRKGEAAFSNKRSGVIPEGTTVSARVIKSPEKGLHILVETSSECVIQQVLVFALDAGVFESECVFGDEVETGDSRQQRACVRCATLRPRLHAETELSVETLVSARGSAEQVHVFQNKVRLSKFSSFREAPHLLGAVWNDADDIGSATFSLHPCTSLEQLSKVLAEMFGSSPEEQKAFCKHNGYNSNEELACAFVLMAGISEDKILGDDNVRCVMHAHMETKGEASAVVRLQCDSLDLAAEMIQDLCKRLNIKHLETSVNFPRKMRALKLLMNQVTEMNDIRRKLGAEMANESQYIKGLVVKAEDARMLGDVTNLASTYQELTTVNGSMIAEYNKRSNNHNQLLASLKEVNNIIQQISKLRVGKPQAAVVAACRKAVKTNNLSALFHALNSQKL